jgi:hypothetical protein
MVFGDRWVYFAFVQNWCAEAESDPKTVAEFTKAASQAMSMVKETLAA